MLTKHKTTLKKLAGFSEIIDYWLNFRQDLIVVYSKIAGLTGDNKNSLPTEEQFNLFCETLVDYISAGHFRIYNMIKTKWESTGFLTNTEIDSLYLGIVETTGPLLSFNDKYTHFVIAENNFSLFDKNISRVGEIMAIRFEKEDLLIQVIAKSLSSQPDA